MRSCIINLPVMYPAQSLNGYMVSGVPAHVGKRKYLAYPRELINDLDDCVGGYEIIPQINLRMRGLEKEYFMELRRVIKKRIIVFKYLYDKQSWDFFSSFFLIRLYSPLLLAPLGSYSSTIRSKAFS